MFNFFRTRPKTAERVEACRPLALVGGLGREMGGLCISAVQLESSILLQETSSGSIFLEDSALPEIPLLDLRPLLRSQPTLPQLRAFWNKSATEVPESLAQAFALFLVFCQKRAWIPPKSFGLRLELPGHGLPLSYAGLAIPFLQGLAKIAGRQLLTTEPAYLAHLCRRDIFGLVRGWDDCLTAQLGRPDALLSILTRPDKVDEAIALPPGTSFHFIPTEDPRGFDRQQSFGRLRDAAFLGKLALEDAVGRRWHHGSDISEIEFGYYPGDRENIILEDTLLRSWREHLERENCFPQKNQPYPAKKALAAVLAAHGKAETLRQKLKTGSDEEKITALQIALEESTEDLMDLFPSLSNGPGNEAELAKYLPADQSLLAISPSFPPDPLGIIAFTKND